MISFKSFLNEELSPSGIYTYFKPTEQSKNTISDFVNGLGISNLLEPEHYHCTVVYAKQAFDLDDYKAVKSEFIVNPNNTQLGLLGSEEEQCLVLLLNETNTIMHKQWEYGKTLGLNYTWNEYKPHITLSYALPSDDCDRLFGLNTMQLPFDLRREIINTPINNVGGRSQAFGTHLDINTIKYPLKMIGEFKEELNHDKF